MVEAKRAFITGITGFVGSHLAEYLQGIGVEVYGGRRWRAPLENIRNIKGKIDLVDFDIRDISSVRSAIAYAKPDYIFHLAAQSYVPQSWIAPSETMYTNIIGTLNVLESVYLLGLDATVHIAGSSEEYGLVQRYETPIKETNQLRPLSPYGISKVACDLMGQQYHASYGMKTVITRAFNHEGPRRGQVFVTSNFARQIAMIEQGLQEPVIYVGNLEAERDYSDVRDVVRAYWLAVNSCEYGTPYNICSGRAWRIGDMLDCLVYMSITRGIEIREEQSRMRPSDVPLLLGDCSKFNAITGWTNEIPFQRTLLDMLEYWRNSDLRDSLKTKAQQ
jgi:GDP-4-dehydro-6-deoxy-D-mannose reductase